MKLGEFIKNFSHNNLIRLHYNIKGGHETVSKNYDDVSMDWAVNKQQGIFRHYIDNEVLGLATICGNFRYPEALNIVIERLDNQPFLEDVLREENFCES